MTPLTVLFAVRVICAAIGAGTIFLGYSLYSLVSSTSDASLAWNDMNFWIKGAGPGFFFGCLGAWIVVSSVRRPLEHKQTSDGGVVTQHTLGSGAK